VQKLEDLTVEDRRISGLAAAIFAGAKAAARLRCTGNCRATYKFLNLKGKFWRAVWDDFRNWLISAS
jgi:hypothetical protein